MIVSIHVAQRNFEDQDDERQVSVDGLDDEDRMSPACEHHLHRTRILGQIRWRFFNQIQGCFVPKVSAECLADVGRTGSGCQSRC